MNKTIFIYCVLLTFGCSSQGKISPINKKSFNTKSLVGFYEDGCTEYKNKKGQKEVDCPFLDLGKPDNNPIYEIQLVTKNTGYYIFHHGKSYNRPAKADTSKLTIFKKNTEVIMQIISKRDTVFEVVESMTPDTLITRNALHNEVRYFYPRINEKQQK